MDSVWKVVLETWQSLLRGLGCGIESCGSSRQGLKNYLGQSGTLGSSCQKSCRILGVNCLKGRESLGNSDRVRMRIQGLS